MDPTLVILAAGLSTRYGRPKQLEPLGPGGETLLDYSLYDGWREGFTRVLLIIREELENAFRERLEGRWPRELEVEFHHQRIHDLPGWAGPAPQRGSPWGTAHALLTARERLQGPFVVLNADDFYGHSPFREARTILERTVLRKPERVAIFGLVGFALEATLSPHGPVNRGLCRVDPRGWLLEVEEILGLERKGGKVVGKTLEGKERVLSGGETVSTNFWVFTPEIFPFLMEGFQAFMEGYGEGGEGREPEFLIPQEVNRVLAGGRARVRVGRARDPFFGITHPKDRGWVVKGLAGLVRDGRYPAPLWGR